MLIILPDFFRRTRKRAEKKGNLDAQEKTGANVFSAEGPAVNSQWRKPLRSKAKQCSGHRSAGKLKRGRLLQLFDCGLL
jgi:hypothetical protein